MVNTRSPKQARELDVLLEQRGARPVSYPCIDIAPPANSAPLDDALRRATAGAFDWLVFTSSNAVEAVEARLQDLGLAPAQLAPMQVAAVGPGTAATILDRLGLTVVLYPQEHVGEALADTLVAAGAGRVLIPQADKAREVLVRILNDHGVQVEAVVAYRTVLGSGGDDVPRLLREGRVDVVTFASPSAVDNMAARLEDEGGDWTGLGRVCVACIGPVTAAAAERRGLVVNVLPQEHTIPALVEDLEHYFEESARNGERGL